MDEIEVGVNMLFDCLFVPDLDKTWVGRTWGKPTIVIVEASALMRMIQ